MLYVDCLLTKLVFVQIETEMVLRELSYNFFKLILIFYLTPVEALPVVCLYFLTKLRTKNKTTNPN